MISKTNKQILKKLYEEHEKGNINNVIDLFEDEELINHITYIMAYDFDMSNEEKAIDDIINTYKKEKLIEEKNEILLNLEDKNLSKEDISNLENKLSEIIIKLAKMK